MFKQRLSSLDILDAPLEKWAKVERIPFADGFIYFSQKKISRDYVKTHLRVVSNGYAAFVLEHMVLINNVVKDFVRPTVSKREPICMARVAHSVSYVPVERSSDGFTTQLAPYTAGEKLLDIEYDQIGCLRLRSFLRCLLSNLAEPQSYYEAFLKGGIVSDNFGIFDKVLKLMYAVHMAKIPTLDAERQILLNFKRRHYQKIDRVQLHELIESINKVSV